MTKTSSSAPSTDNILTGVALMLGFCVTAPLLDVAAKLASSSVPVGQISAARFVLQTVLMAPFIWFMGLSLFYLDEDVGPRRIAACFVGFVGVLFVIQPSFAAFGAVALIPLGTAVAFAFYILVTRGLSQRMHPVALQFHTGLVASLFCIPVLFLAQGSGSDLFDPVMPVGIAWLWLFGAGFFATVSHLMMTYALSLAPSATLAPLQYFELPVATLFA